MSALGSVLAFAKRELRWERSYGAVFYVRALAFLGGVLSTYFIAMLVPRDGALSPYGGSYFAFAAVGLVVMDLFTALGTQPALVLRREMLTGTFEALDVRLAPRHWTMGMAAYPLVRALVRGAVTLLVAASLGAEFDVDIMALIAILPALLMSFFSIGLVSVASVLVFQKPGMVRMFFGGIAWLLSGAYYPVTVLPQWLQGVAWALPTTAAIEGVRQAVLGVEGSHPHPIALLWVFVILGLPLAIWSLRGGLAFARRRGHITGY